MFFERQYIDAIDDLMHDDYVEEYPQSGERIRGKDNARTIYENYPGIPNLIDYSYRLDGDLAVVEMILDYDGKRMNFCDLIIASTFVGLHQGQNVSRSVLIGGFWNS